MPRGAVFYWETPSNAERHRLLPRGAVKCGETLSFTERRRQMRRDAVFYREAPSNAERRRLLPEGAVKCREAPSFTGRRRQTRLARSSRIVKLCWSSAPPTGYATDRRTCRRGPPDRRGCLLPRPAHRAARESGPRGGSSKGGVEEIDLLADELDVALQVGQRQLPQVDAVQARRRRDGTRWLLSRYDQG
jgi:hypothetical protein